MEIVNFADLHSSISNLNSPLKLDFLQKIRYNYLPFTWDELEDMVHRNPNVAGIELVDFESDCDNSSVVAELVEDYLNELNGEDIGF